MTSAAPRPNSLQSLLSAPVPEAAPQAALLGAGRVSLLASLLAALLILAVPQGVRAQEGLALGSTPELVVLETLDGEPVDLADIAAREKPVLLEFWATWCAVCRALEPTMSEAYGAHGDDVEFVVVAAAVAQTRERIRTHLARHPMPGLLLWDTRGRFTRAFDAPGTGYVVILDREGKVAYTGTGPDQDLATAVAAVLASP